jgi:hypothetical protein
MQITVNLTYTTLFMVYSQIEWLYDRLLPKFRGLWIANERFNTHAVKSRNRVEKQFRDGHKFVSQVFILSKKAMPAKVSTRLYSL